MVQAYNLKTATQTGTNTDNNTEVKLGGGLARSVIGYIYIYIYKPIIRRWAFRISSLPPDLVLVFIRHGLDNGSWILGSWILGSWIVDTWIIDLDPWTHGP